MPGRYSQPVLLALLFAALIGCAAAQGTTNDAAGTTSGAGGGGSACNANCGMAIGFSCLGAGLILLFIYFCLLPFRSCHPACDACCCCGGQNYAPSLYKKDPSSKEARRAFVDGHEEDEDETYASTLWPSRIPPSAPPHAPETMPQDSPVTLLSGEWHGIRYDHKPQKRVVYEPKPFDATITVNAEKNSFTGRSIQNEQSPQRAFTIMGRYSPTTGRLSFIKRHGDGAGESVTMKWDAEEKRFVGQWHTNHWNSGDRRAYIEIVDPPREGRSSSSHDGSTDSDAKPSKKKARTAAKKKNAKKTAKKAGSAASGRAKASLGVKKRESSSKSSS